MKKNLFLIILLLSVVSCRTDDDSKDYCTFDCTIVEGTVVSLTNEPVANVNITV